jgi:CheY-like chemotaxis protein
VKDPEIISFTSALKAIEYIKTEYATKPVKTMLFLDINMPTLSGWDVLAKFESFEKIIQSNFKIYMISSSLNPIDKTRAMGNKFVSGYLEKPLNKLAFANILAAKN